MVALAFHADPMSRGLDPTLDAMIHEGASAGPNWLSRLLDAIDRAYYVKTADGEGYCTLPPCF
jgi:hypothetical protein